MWRWNTMVVALMLVQFCTLISNAEDSIESLASRHEWTRFEVVLGRITAFHLRGGQDHCSSDPESNDLPRETISVNGDAAAPAFRYERFESDQTLTVDIINRSQVEIRRQSNANPKQVSLHFVQPARGPLQLTVQDGDDLDTYTARSIWHLLLAHPEASRDHLLPMLAVLRTDWRLIERTSRIEAELFESAAKPVISPREIVMAVSDLDSYHFGERQAADRRLRSWGVAVLPYLSRLDRGTLSVEQRLRLRRIHDDLAAPMADSAERVAAWLSNDNAVWLALLSHTEPSKREVAAIRLAEIYPGIVRFDPFADEPLRSKQIARLRSRLGGVY